MHKIHHNIYLYGFYLHLFPKHLGTFSGGGGGGGGQECLQMFTGPVGPVEVFFPLFYWPEAVLGNFYWPVAMGIIISLFDKGPLPGACMAHF